MTFTKTLLIASAVTLSAMSLSACATFTPTPETNAQDAVETGNYSLDPTHASLTFRISHFGVSDYLGRFNTIDGTLDFDEANPEAAKMVLTAQVDSLDVNNDSFAETLIGESWFDASAHPEARFVLNGITQTGQDRATATGELTLKGVTNPVTFDVRFIGAINNPLTRKYTLGFEAKGSIKRSDYGITRLLSVAGDKFDFDTVHLHFNGEFQKQ
ncbi:YceI family protein [Fretibacter rubidus]|uniref:YceI family protein n=1 Tax=Fretibacter rubidus TaxID=570162 RepID=UPI00352B5698